MQVQYTPGGLPVYSSQEDHESELKWDSGRLSDLVRRLVEEKCLWQSKSDKSDCTIVEELLLEIYKILSIIRVYFRNQVTPPPRYFLRHWADNVDIFERLADICPSLPSSSDHDGDCTSSGSDSIESLIGTTGDLSRALLKAIQMHKTSLRLTGPIESQKP